MAKQQDSTILRKNLLTFHNDKKSIFEKYGVLVDNSKYFCYNLYCEGYNFYKKIKKIDCENPITIEQLFDIMKNHSNSVPYTSIDAAHIVGNKLAEELGYESKVRNHYDNGIFLCKNCHWAYDYNSGKFNPDPTSMDYHNQHMQDICKSKIEIYEEFFKKN